jgi:hypothetical protein
MKIRMSLSLAISAIVFSMALATGCNKKDEETSTPADSQAQQIGDAMASIDDSGGSDGGYVFINNEKKTFARLLPQSEVQRSVASLILPEARAAACSLTATFGACSANQIVRNFQGCSIGTATLTGTVTFSFDDGTVNNVCTNGFDGDTITRVPAFVLTGARGGTFTVSKVGSIGQRLTRTSAGVFAFSNDGIRRVLAYNGTELANYTTSTTSNITITGATRNGRVANGGALRVLNNRTSTSCDFAPSNVTWSSTCNCAVSGTWTATCSSGSSASFAISGCGTGTLTVGTSSETVTLDQCSSI